MTNQEYINEHPEKFADDIDRWLFTEFSIVGGCCSAQGSMEYSVARMVAERLFKAQGNRTYYECMDKAKKQWLDKAVEWIKLYILNHDDIDIFEMETAFKNELMEE